jgi:hypothetical protein
MSNENTWDESSVSANHLVGISPVPTVVIGAGAGAGVDAAAAVSGTDLSMLLTVVADGSPAGSNAVIATVTFANPYETAPHVQLSAANAAAAALNGATSCYATASTDAITLHSGSSALSDDTTYAFSLSVSQ